ncbi:hypothetical protein HF882_12545 [Victivallis vadensis]|uniref:Uncharacterized protein n=1 Tax=Victivallis vadensis TaxID=172901 RepID=A0A848AUK6_9BACT|nr:hypothetical protein [Victivallis vadensis]NMD87414.1 hypothetical protein [Victivallis vadensis]
MRKIIPLKPIKTSTDDDNFIAEREQHYTICKIFFPEFFRVAWRSLHGLLEMANGLQEYFMASKEKNPDLTVIQETLANCSFESLEDIIQPGKGALLQASCAIFSTLKTCYLTQYYLSHDFSEAERISAKKAARNFACKQIPEVLKEAWKQIQSKTPDIFSKLLKNNAVPE